jgi:hypothetical protein
MPINPDHECLKQEHPISFLHALNAIHTNSPDAFCLLQNVNWKCLTQEEKTMLEIAASLAGSSQGNYNPAPKDVIVENCDGTTRTETVDLTVALAGSTDPIPVCIRNRREVDFEIGCASDDKRLILLVAKQDDAGVLTTNLFESDGVTPVPPGVTFTKCDVEPVDWESIHTKFKDGNGNIWTKTVLVNSETGAVGATIYTDSFGDVLPAPPVLLSLDSTMDFTDCDGVVQTIPVESLVGVAAISAPVRVCRSTYPQGFVTQDGLPAPTANVDSTVVIQGSVAPLPVNDHENVVFKVKSAAGTFYRVVRVSKNGTVLPEMWYDSTGGFIATPPSGPFSDVEALTGNVLRPAPFGAAPLTPLPVQATDTVIIEGATRPLPTYVEPANFNKINGDLVPGSAPAHQVVVLAGTQDMLPVRPHATFAGLVPFALRSTSNPWDFAAQPEEFVSLTISRTSDSPTAGNIDVEINGEVILLTHRRPSISFNVNSDADRNYSLKKNITVKPSGGSNAEFDIVGIVR